MKYIELTHLTFIGPASGIEEILKEKIMINFDKVYSFFPDWDGDDLPDLCNTSDHTSDNYSKIEMKRSMITVEESYDTIKDKLK